MNSMPLPVSRAIFLNWLGFALLAFALAGCGHDNVQVYRLSNDDSSSASPPPNTAAAAPASKDSTAVPPGLHWTLPPGWTEVTPGATSVQPEGNVQCNCGCAALFAFDSGARAPASGGGEAEE